MTEELEDRPPPDLLHDHHYTWLRFLTEQPITSFDAKVRSLDLRVTPTGSVQDPGEAFPLGSDRRWVAVATDSVSGDPLAIYEFYSGPADLFDPAAPGQKFVGKAIAVDIAHLGEGIAPAMLQALYGCGYLIVPSELRTAAGVKLFATLAACGCTIPTSGTVSYT